MCDALHRLHAHVDNNYYVIQGVGKGVSGVSGNPPGTKTNTLTETVLAG